MIKIDITSENFEKEVRESEGLIMVFYLAEWCGPCKKMRVVFDSIVNKYIDEDIKFGISDVDESPQLIALNEFVSIPTFILYKDGKTVLKETGRKTEKELIEMLDPYLYQLKS